MVPEFLTSRKLVLFGGAGSGKTELAVNLARMLSEEGDPVHVFDMDQTKPLFRARNAKKYLDEAGVELMGSFQLIGEAAGAPVTVPHVRSSLADPKSWDIFDIGGDKIGARIVGQFSDAFRQHNAQMTYVFNVNRLLSKNPDRLRIVMSSILQYFDPEELTVIVNPYFGKTMTAEMFDDGLERSKKMLEPLGLEASVIFCPEDLDWEPAEGELEVVRTTPFMQQLYTFEFE